MRLLLICSLFIFGVTNALPQSASAVLSVTTLAGKPGTRGYLDGIGSAAQFYGPAGIVVDASGNLFVADTCNSTIRKITPAGVVTIFAGTPFDPDANRIGIGSADGSGTTAQFYLGVGVSSNGTPYGPPAFTQIGSINMAMDGGGNIYVADTLNNTIRKITPAGAVTTFAGTAPQQGSDDGIGSNARFLSPMGVAVDGAGNVFVADSGNGTVRKITSAGVVTTFAGSPRTSGSTDGTGSTARFNSINGIAADSAGNVYVADTNNNTIRKITPAGVVSTLAGLAGAQGSTDGQGNKARFYYPMALAIDSSGNLYVADSGNRTIRKVTSAGVVSTLAGLAGSSGSTDGTGNAARFGDGNSDSSQNAGIAVDSAGNVYVADTNNNTIRKGVPVSNAPGSNLQLLGQPQSLYVKVGLSAVFTVNATATPSPTYQWQKDGNAIPGATSASYTIAATQYTDAGSFAVAVTSGAFTLTSGAATLKIAALATDIPPIYVFSQPASQTVTVGQSATFAADVAATPAPTYQWKKNGAAIPGATSVSYTIAAAQTSDAGTYTLVITNSAATVTTNDATLTVNPVSGLTAPAITTQPTSQTVTVGSTASFTVAATGNPFPTYQWKKNGAPITGAITATLTLANAQTSDAASYTVTVTNSVNAITSSAAVLTVNPAVTSTASRITSLSIRNGAGTGDQTLIAGFQVSGNGKSLLIRGVGPTLGAAPYNVPGVLADPQLNLYNGSLTLITSNDNWSDAANASQVAAAAVQLQDFALPVGSKDAALLSTLNDGLYTAQVSGAGNTTGIALVEVYDANPTAASHVNGVSARSQVGTGANILIAGFGITGTAPMKVLLRGVGPTLATFAVTGVLADPQIAVYTSPGGVQIASNDNWSDNANAAQIAANSGFPLLAGSKDAALLLTLNPGTYTVQVSGVGNTTGVALVEVYEVSN